MILQHLCERLKHSLPVVLQSKNNFEKIKHDREPVAI